MAKKVNWKLADKDDPIFTGRATISSHNKQPEDPVIELMKKYAVEMTKENYIYYSFMGDIPDTLDAEFLASIPEHLLSD